MKKKHLIRFLFVLCTIFSIIDCVFLFINGFIPECLFLLLLPFAGIGAVIAYNKRTDEQKDAEHIGWLMVAGVSLIIDSMILYLALGYEDKNVILIMELITIVLMFLLFRTIAKIKFKM